MVNAAFRLPETSINYLHNRILEAHDAHSPISPEVIAEEIRWREESHSIGPHSELYSSEIGSGGLGVPPAGSESYPLLATSVQRGSVASFPLRLSHAQSYIGEGEGARTALVGDAAHTIHPLAGQGLNLGLADAQALAQSIAQAVRRGGDIGKSHPFHLCTI
jgi:ubiquinone biosynthesis monooxygenase Coq6